MMDPSIERLRQRGREVEENIRRQQEETRRHFERIEDKSAQERRHREMLAATSRPAQSSEGNSASIGGGLSAKFIVIALVVALAFYAFSTFVPHARSTTSATPVAGVGADTAESDSVPPPDDLASESAADVVPETVTNASDSSEVTATELRGPTLAALDAGRSIAWESGKAHGYVTVSDPTSVGDRTCRNIAYTSNQPLTVKPATWCREVSADWAER